MREGMSTAPRPIETERIDEFAAIICAMLAGPDARWHLAHELLDFREAAKQVRPLTSKPGDFDLELFDLARKDDYEGIRKVLNDRDNIGRITTNGFLTRIDQGASPASLEEHLQHVRDYYFEHRQ